MRNFIGLLIAIGMVVTFMVVAECVAAPIDPTAGSIVTPSR